MTNSDRYLGTDITDLTQPVDPEKRIYNYDPIGNRTALTEGTDTGSYVTNSLNQYDTVTFAGETTNLDYDEDGSLTGDGEKTYTWNAENRLVAVAPVTPADGNKKTEFVYDYMGRRVKKTVSVYGSGTWTEEGTTLFVYDGWNLIQELDGTGTVLKSYVNGLDLSQSLQGAGGIGGILATVDHSTSAVYFHLYDGNGNTGQLINSTDGSIVAHYEYDPFGKIIALDGGYADDNAFRFSTKYHDTETNLIYYGYRHYSPELGRWINRDPVGTAGGPNLYEFVANIPNYFVDRLGLLLVAIDGTGSKEWRKKTAFQYWNSHVRNFYDHYKTEENEQKRYFDGPSWKMTGVDAFKIHKEALKFIKGIICKKCNERINLVGHSRGGYIVMEIARSLQAGITCDNGTKMQPRVNFLGLYDAVDMVLGYGKAETIPANIDYSAHAMGKDDVNSRWYFNTADHGPESSEQREPSIKFFDATHGGLGGDPWGGDHPSNMTEERDIVGSAEADKFIRREAKTAGIEFTDTPRYPSPNINENELTDEMLDQVY